MVRGVDDSVGAILEAMRSHNMLTNSIVLFMSDNGAPTVDPTWGFDNQGSNWPLRGTKSSCHEGGVRTVAALWSSLVTGNRIFNHLFHITDWLPTLYSAAGGDVADLGEVDGVNQWASLKGKQGPGPRSELLVDLNPITDNKAIIRWPWKLVTYSSKYPTLNTYSGESGRGSEVPEYSLDQVTRSPAALALSLMQPTRDLLALRARATINSRCHVVTNSSTMPRPCDQRFCLFNLLTDPCESADFSESQPNITASMKQMLVEYQNSAVTPQARVMDPAANPRLWNNYWAPWADERSASCVCSPLASLLIACLLVIFNRVAHFGTL